MDKLKNNQKGFTAIEILLAIIILVLMGIVGYMVYHNDHKTKTAFVSTAGPKTSTRSTESSTTTTTNPYAGWKTYSGLSPVTFKYPSNWTVSSGHAAAGNQAITVNAPARDINGTSYQFGLGMTVYSTTSQYIPSAYTVYSSSAIADTSFPQRMYFLLTEAPINNGSSSCVTDVQVGSQNLPRGATSGQTIPTSTVGKDLDIDGNYTLTNPPSGDSYDQTIGCFNGSDFSSYQEVQQAQQIVSSLTEN